MKHILGTAEIDANGVVHVDPEDATYTEISIEALQMAAGWFRTIERVRELANQLAKVDWRGNPPVEHQISRKILEALDGEK